MASTLKHEPEFVVEKPVLGSDHLRFVRRVVDGDRYLAQDYDHHDFPELRTLREPKPDDKIIAFEAAARVLNHENLISVVKPITLQPPLFGPNNNTKRNISLVHEFCADGNLQQLFDEPPMYINEKGFLPEGLVWHVAISILRALMFLHEGCRENVVMHDDGTVSDDWYRPDDDWMPILHRSVRPENIWFQARKGRETYGLCKLGDFSRCVVAGTARLEGKPDPVEVVAVLNNRGKRDVSLEKMRRIWDLAHQDVGPEKDDWTKTEKYGRVYTFGSELADLGGILYRMMTGNEIEVDQCQCGCWHIDPAGPGCQCSCAFKDVNLKRDLEETKYSYALLDVVIGLIRSNRDNSARATDRYDFAWSEYRMWKRTAQGRAHFDHHDDLMSRNDVERIRRLDEIMQQRAGDENAPEWVEMISNESLIRWN